MKSQDILNTDRGSALMKYAWIPVTQLNTGQTQNLPQHK